MSILILLIQLLFNHDIQVIKDGNITRLITPQYEYQYIDTEIGNSVKIKNQ